MVKLACKENQPERGWPLSYRQEIIQDVTLFTSQSAAMFYDKLFSSLDFTLPRAATGRRGFPAANLNTLAHISALAVALAAVLSDSHSYRASRSFRRGA